MIQSRKETPTSINMEKTKSKGRPAGPSLVRLIAPYTRWILLLVLLTAAANGLNLLVPKIVSNAIDAFSGGRLIIPSLAFEFTLVAIGIFVFTYLQSIVQTYTSERVARDLREKLIAKISEQDYASIQESTPAKLLTNLTSDIDAIKNFVAMAISSIISSVFLIIGTSILLILIETNLALAVLTIVPVVGGTFFVIFSRIRKLFKRAQEAIDWLNKVINESILGSALIRIVNSQRTEYDKFKAANAEARDIGMGILKLFASLIPIIGFVSNIATLIILTLGGHYVITGRMSLGDFTAFNNYLFLLIFPIILLGFMSNLIAQASASYARISEVLLKKNMDRSGNAQADFGGDISLDGISVRYGEKFALKEVSFRVPAGTRTAIIGPTAAGKTQLLYLLTGLIRPSQGMVSYAGRALTEYDQASLHNRITFVFQDSIIFNLSLRENIAFSSTVNDEDLRKAIATAELTDFVATLPEGLDTIVSERGASLSGGQKQRIMLARALSLNPSVLLLDDFTARVDANTEKKILQNVALNYPGMTLISVTQKVASIEDYDQIILLMEGEMLARGKHQELLATSPEYVQIYESQQSTSSYELQPE